MLKDFIQNELSKIERSYVDSPEKMVSEYNNEIRNTEEYRGRQLLELLQNADDASVTDKEHSVLISFFDNRLIVANNGEAFSKAGILSLMYANLSPKFKQQNKIGHKGLGFRSLLSWAKSIYIKSEGLSMKFSKDSAKTFLNSILNQKNELRQRIKELSNEEYPIATLLAPEWVDNIDEEYCEYDTYIVIECIDEVKEDIEKQIEDLDKEIMLFLNNINSIKIDSELRKQTLSRTFLSDNELEIKISVEEDIVSKKTWMLNKKSGQYNGKDYDLVIAYNEQLSDTKNVLYSYFRTDVNFPFPAIVHGTFDLSGNRNQLIKNKENDFLIGELIGLLIDTAIKITKNKDNVNYSALRLLAFEDKFDPVMNDYFKFKEKLIERIKASKIFPTISGQYIEHKDKPISYRKPYADILPSHAFKNLLIFADDEKVISLLDKLSLCRYKYDYLVNSINEIANELTISQKVACLKYILEDYKKELEDKEVSIKPLLLIDSEGKLIKEETEVFLPAENDIFKNMPAYIKLKFLNKDMFNEFGREFGSTSVRSISEKLKVLNVFEYNFDPVIRRISNYTWQVCNEQPEKKLVYIKTFLTWLFGIYVSNKDKLPQISLTINIPCLTRGGDIEKTDELYFGIEYNNFVGEKVLQNIEEAKFAADYKEFNFDSNDINLIIEFFKWLRVSFFPRTSLARLKSDEQKIYKEHVFANLNPIKVQDYDFSNLQELNNKIYSINAMDVLQVKLLDQILETAEFQDILVWLMYDNNMKNIIESKTEIISTAKVEIQFKPYNSNVRKIYSHQMASYLNWKLRRTPWIKTQSGIKAIPSKCCLAKNISNEFSPLIEIPDINYSDPIFKKYGFDREDVEYWLDKIGVPKDFSDFTTSTAYSILLRLPEVDREGKNAKALYRQIIQNSTEEKWDKDNTIYKKYMNEGKVYASLDSNKDYFPIKDVYYLDNRMFCEDIIKQFPILELEKRSGEKKVNAILGVKPLKNINFRIVEEPTLHELNNKFTIDIQAFLPYVYCYRIDKDAKHTEREALKETKIYLCTDIKAAYTIDEYENYFEVNPYEYIYIENDKKIFLKIEANSYKDLVDLKNDFRFRETIAEIFAGIIKVEENRKDFRELYAKSISQRDATLRSDLDDEKLVKLAEAKKWLDICTDNKLEMWNIITGVVCPGVSLPEEEADLIKVLSAKLGIGDTLIEKMFNEFDYNDLDGKDKNTEMIIELFKTLSIDTSNFNSHSIREINLTGYYSICLEKLKSNYRKKYYSRLYNQILNFNLEVKSQFERRKTEYDNISVCFENSVEYDVEKEFFKKLQLTKEEIIKVQEIDLSKMFHENKAELLTKLKGQIKTEIIADEFNSFCDKSENKSLIYFKEYMGLVENYKAILPKSSSNNNSNGGLPKPKEETPAEKLKRIMNGNGTEVVLGNSSRPNEQSSGQGGNGGGHHGGNGRLTEKQKEEMGFIGECYVYSELVKKYGVENVTWASEYGKRAEVNEDGKDGLGYDIKYISQEGNPKFVEVKSTSGEDIVFYITKGEVAFAETHKENYELYEVVNVFDENNRRIINLENIFVYSGEETFTNNNKFFVENKDYRIKAEYEKREEE